MPSEIKVVIHLRNVRKPLKFKDVDVNQLNALESWYVNAELRALDESVYTFSLGRHDVALRKPDVVAVVMSEM